MTGSAIATAGLVRDYGHGAGIHGVDLEVPRSGVYALVGPNGAGKTTLLSIVAGLRRSDAGEIRLSVDPERIAICPDTPEFEPWLTAAEVVRQSRGLAAAGRRRRRAAGTASGDRSATPGAADGADATAGRDPVAHALEEVGLTHAADRRTGGFSRGMKQRLGLAVALVLDPQVLILDEPTSALDPSGRADVLSLVSALGRSRTVIFSSHVLADVQRVADTVGVLNRGRLLFQGPVSGLIDQHLRPAWELRLRDGAQERLAGLLRTQEWVTAVTVAPDGALRVEAVSQEAGERGLPKAVAEADAALVGLRPLDADLEAAFLALTGEGPEKPGSDHEVPERNGSGDEATAKAGADREAPEKAGSGDEALEGAA